MKKRYKITVLFVSVISAYAFYKHYIMDPVDLISYRFAGITIAAAAVVHVIKCIRLYLVLYGVGISFQEHVRLYCMAVPVSMVLPFKLGDAFRAYCYGYHVQDYLKGMIAVILDRFVDALALASMVFVIYMAGNSVFPAIFYALLLFLFLTIACYHVFPGICKYWKKYLLKCRATLGKNAALKLVAQCGSTYLEIHKIMKGKFMALFLLSFLAWAIEIGRLALFNSIFTSEKTTKMIAGYLLSALYKSDSIYLKQFICASIVMMLMAYIVLEIYEKSIKSRGK